MAMAGRLRSGIPLLNRILRSDSLSAAQRPAVHRALPSLLSASEFSRNYSSGSAQKEGVKVKVPITLFGGTGNYATALFISAKKANQLDKVESEILAFVEAAKESPVFTNFTKDLSIPAATRVKALSDVCADFKFCEITKNFLVILAENGRLRYLESIANKFVELTMADRGEVKAIVTSVIALPPEEEKELKETLQDIIGRGKKVKVEQKIDPGILGGIVVEFGQKVFDMSIKTRALQMERFLREPINFDSI